MQFTAGVRHDMQLKQRHWLGIFAALAIMALFAATSWLRPYERRLASTLVLVHEAFPQVQRVTVHDLSAWLADTNRPQPGLYDVRTPDEFAVSHLPGAIRMDPRSRAHDVVKRIDPAKPAVFYCSVGHRSSQMADQLRVLGRTNVFSVEGSIFAWSNAGLPLVSNDVPVKLVHPFSESYARLLPPEARYPLPSLANFANEYGPRLNPLKATNALILLAFFLAWESFAPFFDWFRKHPRQRTAHGLRNIALGLLNTLVIVLVFVRLWMAATNWAAEHDIGLLNWLGAFGWQRTVLTVLLLDAWTWSWHWLNHHVSLFWWFHRTHHTELRMDVTSANRFHLGEIVGSSLLRIPLFILLGIHLKDLLVYETLLFAVVQFHHANIRVPWAVESWLRWIIVTPNMHRVHHSQDMEESNSNFASLLSIWDVMFNTWAWRRNPHEIRYGLTGCEAEERHTLKGMLRTPFED
jgi:sterol desaturase/sphingolipid hydroxylase (fatty acid hydroxylase superfamily)/rhodanese-related sulfurtransferase